MSVWLQRRPAAAPAGRVFCIPQAGSGTTVFDNWPAERAGVEFLPVELPGRLSRFTEAPPDTLEDLAAAMIDGLEPYLRVPFAFFGHCWSAILAYEVTRRLERAGHEPARLFVSSEVPPQAGPAGRMLDMDADELAAEVAATVRDIGRKPHPELVDLYVRILRSDIELRRNYQAPEPIRLSCPITVFGWRDDPEYPPGSLAGWAECGNATFIQLPGRHNEFNAAPADLIDTILAGVRERLLGREPRPEGNHR
ncbi:thioesterase domain-containing protein [Micromonospora sp. NPDC126480]|uniref:thioesterase II family protein n=1 Tax=Micromonospora sp. NPDC126480 TaxID=3155312 RepID=UPI00332CA28C